MRASALFIIFSVQVRTQRSHLNSRR